MMLKPGSFPWLLAHDIRLNWRRFSDMLGSAGTGLLVTVFLAGGAVLHALAWAAVKWLSPVVYGAGAGQTMLATIIVCTFTWMIAQSLFATARALFDRGDLDLLLGSPVSIRRVFAAKALAIAAGTFGSLALLLLPIANAGAITDRPAWLGIYPVLIGLALIATALALMIAIGLFFLLGPRRARIVTQLTGAVIGGAFVLGAQIVAMLSTQSRHEVLQWFEHAWAAPGNVLRPLLTLPIEAMHGDAAAMLLLLAIGIAMFSTVVVLLGDRFARASLAAAGSAAEGASGGASGRRMQFGIGLGQALRRKEWRLLIRDPGLFAQLGLQIIYTIPIAVVLLRNESLPAALALAPTLVVVAAQISASLAWITVSGEDAPELIASAPVTAAAVDRAKLGAVALPVAVILALPLLGLALVSWPGAVISGVFAAAAACSTALLNFWHPMPGNRRGMLRRHSQSKLIALVEHALALSWAVAIVLAMLESELMIAPVLLVAAILLIAWRRHRNGQTPANAAPALIMPWEPAA